MASDTSNDSFHTSGPIDASIDNECSSVIVYFPFSDPGSLYEIVSLNDVINWGELQAGTEVTVHFMKAKVQGIVVCIPDDSATLEANFDYLTEQFQRVRTEKNRWKRNGSTKIIKVADKELQTDVAVETETKDKENEDLKRQLEKLQNDYNRLIVTLSEVKTHLQGTISKLELPGIPKSEEKDSTRAKRPLQTIHVDKSANNKENYKEMMEFGAGGTKILRHVFKAIKWDNYSAATKSLLMALFPRDVLATHSLTGKPSPAFLSSTKETKMRLNPKIVRDIIQIVMSKCHVGESLVRSAITTKCADENKMYKKRNAKSKTGGNENAAKRIKSE